jgi:Holliday junction resolvasome RuvABC DNA-binding subunit
MINGSVGSDRTVTQSDSPLPDAAIKDDDEALDTLKSLGFDNIQVKDMTTDIIRQIEEAFGVEQGMAPRIKRLKSYVEEKEKKTEHLKSLEDYRHCR